MPDWARLESKISIGQPRTGCLTLDLLALIMPFLSNVPLAWANTLSWSMLGLVTVFLLVGPVLVYTYYKKYKRERQTPAPTVA